MGWLWEDTVQPSLLEIPEDSANENEHLQGCIILNVAKALYISICE
jgi:hypothetical protein